MIKEPGDCKDVEDAGFIQRGQLPLPHQLIIARCNVMKFCPVFSCKSIIVLGLIFRSSIYLEFVFVNSFRKGSNFNLLHVDIQFPQNRWLK